MSGVTWTMRSGKEILIKNMTERHIKNAIKMLEKNKHLLKSNFTEIEMYLGSYAGDHAQQISAEEWLDIYTAYPQLKVELENRCQP